MKVGASAAHEVHAFIDSVERIASNVMRVTLELAEGEWMEFRPGQFMQIVVPGLGVLRSYSPSVPSRTCRRWVLIRLTITGQASGNDLTWSSGMQA